VIEALLFGNVGAMAETGRRFQVLVQRDPLRFDSEALRTALERMSAGGWIAYAIAFKAPLVARLVTLAMLPWRLRCVERTIVRGGAQIVGRYGVDPNLDAPFCIYELHSPAAEYADRRLRTRGSAQALRRILARCFVCDPALGGVVVIGKRL
jgi:pimeloyl-ACP methyl ester carboxylesterase